MLERHPSTTNRVLRCNTGQRGCHPNQAQGPTDTRRPLNARQIDDAIWQFALERLQEQWSPDLISKHVAISHETIYQRVYTDKKSGGTLWRNLRSQKQRHD